MASPSPVPSRAALNALRGVILTTSCSVILLAEERRRRLKLARAAIENARKLHAVRTNRGPVPPTDDGPGSWEGIFADTGDQVLAVSSLPRLRTSTRRRRRSVQTDSSRPNQVNQHSSAQAACVTEGRPSAASWTSMSELRSWVSGMLSLISLKLMLAPWKTPSQLHKHEWKLPTALATPNATASFNPARPSTLVSGDTLVNGEESSPVIPEQQKEQLSEAQQSKAQSLGLDTAPVDEQAAVTGRDAAAVVSLRRGRARTGRSDALPEQYGELAALEQLLQDLESRRLDQAEVSDRLELVASILQRLASFNLTSPAFVEPLKRKGIRLLWMALDSGQAAAADVLAVLLHLACTDPVEVFVLLGRLAHNRSSQYMGQALRFFSDGKRRRVWERGMLVRRILNQAGNSSRGFQEAEQLYRAMQAAGLFQRFDISLKREYKIRRFMVLMAVKRSDDAFVCREMQAIEELEPDAMKFDVILQRRLAVREAVLGHWESVDAHIETLKSVAEAGCIEVQATLASAVDIFSQDHTPRELEAFLRHLFAEYRLKPKRRWVFTVLDGYAGRHEIESVFSWLQYCIDSGLCVDDDFMERLYARCRKYWSFSDTSIARLQDQLQASSPWLPGVDACGILTGAHDDDGTGPSSLALSGHSLRLEVVQALETQGTVGVERAMSLVQCAHQRGDDVSKALMPLLLARLKGGEDPNDVINEALHMGVRVHDSAYNKAAQALSTRGDQQGAVAMCEFAARKNGKGDLLYNEYNFSNLVFAYTGLGRYKELLSLLSGFVSEVQWWRGSPRCKESIKFAMKAAAMRTVVHKEDKEKHMEALYHLDEALLHVKKCRSNGKDRLAVSEAIVGVVTGSPEAGAEKALEGETESLEPVAGALLVAAGGGG